MGLLRMLRGLLRTLTGATPDKGTMTHGTAAFVDSNIILEGRPLADLPWADVDPQGPICVYVVPQVLNEVDRKKHDGRLQLAARQFNRLMSPLVTRAEEELTLIDGTYRVVLRLAEPEQIKWAKLDGFDREDGDSLVVAEAIHAPTPAGLRRVIVSQDLNPIAKATRHGFEAFHVDATWLRAPEPNKFEKDLLRLQTEVQLLRKEQPALDVRLECLAQTPVTIHRVAPIDDAGRTLLTSMFMDGVKSTSGRNRLYEFSGRHISQEQVDNYRDKDVPAYVDQLPQQLELRYGQVQLVVKIENKGAVHATGMIVKVTASGGLLNRGVIISKVSGPPKPVPYDPMHINVHDLMHRPVPPRGKQELYWVKNPSMAVIAELQCDDFRAGRSEEIKFVFWLDPRSDRDAVAHIETSAQNLKGTVTTFLPVPKRVVDSTWDMLIESNGAPKLPSPTDSVIRDAIARESYTDLDFRSD